MVCPNTEGVCMENENIIWISNLNSGWHFCMVSYISHDHYSFNTFSDVLFIVATLAIPTSNIIFKCFYFAYYTYL